MANNTHTLGYRVHSIIDSHTSGQTKQMIEQYEDACLAFDTSDVLLMLRLSESITDKDLATILIAILSK